MGIFNVRAPNIQQPHFYNPPSGGSVDNSLANAYLAFLSQGEATMASHLANNNNNKTAQRGQDLDLTQAVMAQQMQQQRMAQQQQIANQELNQRAQQQMMDERYRRDAFGATMGMQNAELAQRQRAEQMQMMEMVNKQRQQEAYAQQMQGLMQGGNPVFQNPAVQLAAQAGDQGKLTDTVYKVNKDFQDEQAAMKKAQLTAQQPKPLKEYEAKAVQLNNAVLAGVTDLENLLLPKTDVNGVKAAPQYDLSQSYGIVEKLAPNKLKGTEQQLYEMGKEAVARNLGYFKSGATIGETEYEGLLKAYVPNAGDTPEVIAKKLSDLKAATAQLVMDVQTGKRSFDADKYQASIQQPAVEQNPLKINYFGGL